MKTVDAKTPTAQRLVLRGISLLVGPGAWSLCFVVLTLWSVAATATTLLVEASARLVGRKSGGRNICLGWMWLS